MTTNRLIACGWIREYAPRPVAQAGWLGAPASALDAGRGARAASAVHETMRGMGLDFTAIDFETANSSSASACSVGLVKVRDGVVVDKAAWFIRPPFGHDMFNEWNTRIHGITAAHVVNALQWTEQLPRLVAFADGDPLVAHNAGFDMRVITSACSASGVASPAFRYLCSLQVARKTYSLDSYRLPVAAMAAGFEDFSHHDALADSEACAAIMVHAANRHGAGSMDELAELAGIRWSAIGEPDAAALVAADTSADYRAMALS